MNEFDLIGRVLSEQWIIVLLFLLSLYWAYKLIKYFLWEYLVMIKDNHWLERDRQEVKDVHFFKAIGDIIKVVKEWDEEHIDAHSSIASTLNNWHIDIKNKLNDIHTDVKLLSSNK